MTTKTEKLLDLANGLDNCGDTVMILKIETIKQLVELVKLQHEALKLTQYYFYNGPDVREAIAAYEVFENGEG